MPLPSSLSGDLSQSPTKYDSDGQQETIETENHENHNSSNNSRDGLSLDIWRTCPVALIRSDPVMRTIYDRGFVSGFYKNNLKQSIVTSVITPPTESTEASEAVAEVTSAGAEFEPPSEAAVMTKLLAVDLEAESAFDNAIESALDNAVEIAEASMQTALVARAISYYNSTITDDRNT